MADIGLVDVVVRGYGGRMRRAGIRLHRSEILAAADTAARLGIPATTPARALFDLERAPRRLRPSATEMRHAIRQAAVLGFDLHSAQDWDGTRSELETRFVTLCRRNRLPMPETNVAIAGFEVDFLWRENCLVVETDGFKFHRGRIAFEEDRRRDLRLQAAGYHVVRLTYRQLVDEPGEIVDTLRSRLNLPRLAS
jgi:very-short-patch-repair endonuclease